MSVIDTPQQNRKDVRGTFIEALARPQPPSLVDMIATEVKSQADKENYAWLGEVSALEEWVDEMPEGDMLENTDVDAAGYELVNKKYATALRFRRDDMNDQKTGGLNIRVRDLAQRASRKADALLIDALVAGTTATDYTGEAFFTATHATRGAQSSMQSNLLTGSGITTANCATNIASAVAALYNYLDEAGEPLNEVFRQLYILYPPALHKPISEAVKAGVISQTSNVQFSDQDIMLIKSPRLTSTSAVDYYVGIKDAEVRGLIWQDRESITMETNGPQSDSWVQQEQQIFKVRLRGRAGYGRWQRCVLINNTD